MVRRSDFLDGHLRSVELIAGIVNRSGASAVASAAHEATHVTSDIQLQTIGPGNLDLLAAMYDRFDPLGVALGLPPRTLEARQRWIRSALRQIVNVAAFSPAGEVVGHSFLAVDNPGSAEVAVFVHQGFRRRGIGAALLREALRLGRAAQLQRVWAVTASENGAALRLLMSRNFRLMRSDPDRLRTQMHLLPKRGVLRNDYNERCSRSSPKILCRP
jgi:ribosomal protein S18 acetylase RimI-like enzyme